MNYVPQCTGLPMIYLAIFNYGNLLHVSVLIPVSNYWDAICCCCYNTPSHLKMKIDGDVVKNPAKNPMIDCPHWWYYLMTQLYFKWDDDQLHQYIYYLQRTSLEKHVKEEIRKLHCTNPKSSSQIDRISKWNY